MQRGRGAYWTRLWAAFETLSGVPCSGRSGAEHLLKECRGLLFSDQVLFSGDRETGDIEMRVAFANSAVAMIKLGSFRTD